MSEVARDHLPIRPMDVRPIDYPLRTPGSLGEDALNMYSRGCYSHILDHDVFAASKKRSGYISPAKAQSFQPTPRMLAAIEELTEARLAGYSASFGHQLLVTRVHEHYTVAFGRGSQFIKVSAHNDDPHDSELLAVLVGGDLESRESRTSGISEVALRPGMKMPQILSMMQPARRCSQSGTRDNQYSPVTAE